MSDIHHMFFNECLLFATAMKRSECYTLTFATIGTILYINLCGFLRINNKNNNSKIN